MLETLLRLMILLNFLLVNRNDFLVLGRVNGLVAFAIDVVYVSSRGREAIGKILLKGHTVSGALTFSALVYIFKILVFLDKASSV